jgi:hypothetical protein
MAKPLGPKSLLIRDAIKAHPKMGNTELAELINGSDARKEDKIEVKPGDIAQQRQAMKKVRELPKPAAAGNSGGKKGGRKGSRRAAARQPSPAPASEPRPAPAAAPSAGPVDLIDKTLDLAQQCGGMAALKKLVDRLADMQKW